jgi:hypothetical protein
MGVYYRDKDGAYTDLTHYVETEGGSAQIIVGDRRASPFDFLASNIGSAIGSITLQPNAITTPGLVTMTPPFDTASYQSDETGETFARATVTWDEPVNTDASIITDGAHYQIRYRIQ